jgi:MFS family permease
MMRKSLTRHAPVLIRLLVVFLFGLLIGSILVLTLASSSPFWQIWSLYGAVPDYTTARHFSYRDYYGIVPYVIILLVPLGLGCIAALIRGRRSSHIVLSALGAGVLAWLGASCYPFYSAYQSAVETNTYCAQNYCHGGAGIISLLIIVLLFVGILLVLSGALITGLIMKRRLKKRERLLERGRGERKSALFVIALRLLLAFLFGLLLYFTAIATSLSVYYDTTDIFYLFPFCIGVAAAFLGGRRSNSSGVLALTTGLATWLGIGCYYVYYAHLKDVAHEASCAIHFCYPPLEAGSGVAIAVMDLTTGTALVILGTLMATLLMNVRVRINVRGEGSSQTSSPEWR